MPRSVYVLHFTFLSCLTKFHRGDKLLGITFYVWKFWSKLYIHSTYFMRFEEFLSLIYSVFHGWLHFDASFGGFHFDVIFVYNKEVQVVFLEPVEIQRIFVLNIHCVFHGGIHSVVSFKIFYKFWDHVRLLYRDRGCFFGAFR